MLMRRVSWHRVFSAKPLGRERFNRTDRVANRCVHEGRPLRALELREIIQLQIASGNATLAAPERTLVGGGRGVIDRLSTWDVISSRISFEPPAPSTPRTGLTARSL